MKTNVTLLRTAMAALSFSAAVHAALPYTIVDSGQSACYDNRDVITPPKPGQPFFGQDAQFQAHPASYKPGADGLTVIDQNTGLVWQCSPDVDGDGSLDRRDKLTFAQAQALPGKLNSARYGGFSDWRLPSIKELYSLFNADGTDPSGYSGTDTSGLTPFIDTKYFKFAYGNTSGERVIDSQYASSTRYVGKGARGFDKLFGVNFADGRIKGYDLQMPGGAEKTFYVQCVRGNPAYGKNDFHDHGDGTITDRATGLVWSKTDSVQAMNWQDSLAWVAKKNAEKFLGHDDWRMPSVKELQSIVDYARCPDTTDSPAIDPVFACTKITNEGGKADFPCYWSATTHSGFMGGGAAMYVAFGRSGGWMSPRGMAGGAPERRGPGGPSNADAGDYHFTDVHGAGAQRSDPKSGDPKMFPHGRGPQGDVIRIFNHVRLVRGGDVVKRNAPASPKPATAKVEPKAAGAFPDGPPDGPGMNPPPVHVPPAFAVLDLNSDGTIDSDELAKAAISLKKLDGDGDGEISPEEFRPPPPAGAIGPGPPHR